ncbi:non-ribosomal peptide synthetase [Streptomyces roseicoloratus]|uniref:non-ribosomal peptide synthetase n=1 Tax=Streptomyces roseicoloratus TaxID=2508722 RepID=UPI0013E91611|nr:non-ribosomal peptide synthetase [Streptomyces roseicoloratus]
MSAAQHDVWIAHQLDAGGALHNCAGYVEIRGRVDEAHLAEAVRRAVGETDALRVKFVADEKGTPWQVPADADAPLHTKDFGAEADPFGAAEEWVRSDLATPVDLAEDPLFTHTLLRLAPDHFLFHLRYHHIVLDGYGQVLYWRRLAQIYTALEQGTPVREKSAGTLRELLDEEAEYRASPAHENDRAHWLAATTDWPDRISLSDRGAGSSRPAERFRPPVRVGRVDEMAARYGAPWSVVVLAATAAYLHRITRQDEIAIGLPVRARTTRTALTTPGMLANVLPLRLSPRSDMPFRELVQQVSARAGEVLAHQRFRGEALQRELRRNGAAEEPSGVVVNVVSFDGRLRFGGLDGTVRQVSSGPVRDLAIEFFGGADGADLLVSFDPNPELHDAATVAAHRERFTAFLETLVEADEQRPLGAIDLLTPAERGLVEAEATAHLRKFDLSRPLHALVEEQAARTPDAVAAETEDGALTYRELTGRARALAARLRADGVAAGQVVGVYDERSLDLVVALLAVMMSGAAYLPLDPELPASRVEFQIEDSGARAVLTRSDLAGRLTGTAARVLAVDELLPTLPESGPLPGTATPDDTAYVIYTSGSTGRPKGVAVPHRGVVNRLLWMQEEYGLTADDRVLQKTPFTFDVSVWEFFWPLLTGAALHLAAPGAQRDPRALADVIRRHRITTVHFVPSMLDLFLAEPTSRDLPALRRVFCSGEALRSETVGRYFALYGDGPALHNLYGPTEASIDVTYWRCTPQDAHRPVPIGRAVANTSLYVLDREGRPLPPGIPGELHIGGVQLATGYLNRPELTAASFVDNPFGPGRLYRTGDLAVLREDGVVLYRGRLDHQVKVHGFRIEPGEIESALLGHPAVEQAVVTAPAGSDGQRQLVAHLVPAGDSAPAATELREWLRERLPAYMTPAHFVALDALPLLSNGKLDRKALPVPEARPARGTTPPRTAEEKLLHQAWRTVLDADEIGVDDSFFVLGGDSMHAIRVRAEAERGGLTFDVSDLFARPSIRELARAVRPLEERESSSDRRPFGLLSEEDRRLLPDGLDDAYPLSAMQAGMLYHAAYAEDSSVYRVVTSARVAARLDPAALRAAIDDTAARHPSLRCSFDLARYSEPLQLVHGHVEIPLETGLDLGDLDDEARLRAVTDWVEEAKFTRFDPEVAPLLKFVAHPCGPDAFELSVIEHHVVLDGWSDMRMLEEVADHYRARLAGRALSLPPVRSAYRDFVAAERRALADERTRDYWTALLRGAEPTRLVPRTATGQEGPEGTRPAANHRYDVPVDDEVAAALRALAGREGLPLKSLLTTAHLAVLRLVSGDDEVLTGVVANARLEEEGGDETIGVFLNTLPLRLDLASAGLLDTARRVFDHERRSAAHRRYPFAQMQHDVGEGLRLDSYVNFMDFHRDRHRSADGLMTVTVGVAETNYPLAVNFLIDPELGRLQLWLDCDLAVLPEEFCSRLAGYYERALAAVARQPETRLTAVDLLAPAEHAQLAAWNDTAVAYDTADTIHGQFERQVRAHPDAIAVAHRFDELSYAELDARANRLAHHLRAQGVGRGDLVGVSLRRGTDLVVTLLAVLKSGAAYVPMDPSFPAGRLAGIASDAGIGCLVRGPGTPDGITAPRVVDVVADAGAIERSPATPPGTDATGDDTAYVIYTSGSTGKPKGTALRHRNAVNFFAGMDERVGCDGDDVVLAVTSVSFDISVLELLWPLTHGAKVVVAGERVIGNLVPQSEARERALGFSLFFFAASAGQSHREGYQLVLDAARYADTHGFEAVWTPERHFHEFGGLYPNPSVMSAALATITDRIALRCGSVVSPLHDAVRIAEEWSLVDNLSNGRVGLAFAAGWNSNDFVLRPENFPVRKERMTEQLEEFRTLWRGEPVRRVGGSGETVDVRIFPAPVQDEPPIWLTSVGTVQTFEKAGASGANLLTHLFGQNPDDLAEKIKAYRQAREAAGHTGPGQVTVMVHTFMSDDTERARQQAREPFRDYLRSSTELWRTLFASTGQDLPEMGAEDQIDAVIDMAIDRYFETSGLFGSPDSCAELVRALAAAGVDEIACLVDFGVEAQAVLDSLTWVDRLRDAHATEVAEGAHSFAALCERHRVTLVQGTPSLFTAVAAEPAALDSLRGLRALLIGGEAFPSGLAQRLLEALPDVRICNMYGPTETTIWSTVHELDPARDATADTIPIGRPIANTEVLVVDGRGRPLPVGVSGELWIGGDGVAAGYVGRPELTAERFVSGADGRGRYYRTGDRVRRRADGGLEFLGRIDRQVKILGHRVEPDEVESVLSRHAQLDAVAVTAVEGAHGTELVAYVSPADSLSDASVQDAHVRRWGELWENAYTGAGGDGQDGTAADGAAADGSEFAGWLSSYTGEPIPVAEMREWLGHTVERVRALRPTAVADIGVGVGLVLRNLADQVEEYHGVDVSPAALTAAAGSLGRPLPGHVHLEQSGPDYLARLAPGSLDTVVINSVAQYFPGTDYLRTVLTDAVRAVRPGGAVFVGDVRSVEMLPEFQTAVTLHRAGPLQTVEEIRSAVARRLQEERELCLSPAFFQQLATDLDGIAEVRLELKRGLADNELSLFRYDVTLLVGDRATPATPASRLSWDTLDDGLDGLRKRLTAGTGGLAVTGIPNRRLLRTAAAVRALEETDGTATAWDLERLLWDLDEEAGIHPEEMFDLAAAHGRPVRVLVPQDGRLSTFDVEFGSPVPAHDDAEDKA